MTLFLLLSLLSLSIRGCLATNSFTTLSLLNSGHLNPAITSLVCILIIILCVLIATYVYWPVRFRRPERVRA